MGPVSEQRLTLVHPYLAQQVRKLADILAARCIDLEVTQGLRTWNEQEQLYAKGRTAPGPKVTNAQPGWSWHNFGLAVDVVPEGIQGQPDWNTEHPAWATIHEEALTLGFVCGSDWRTFPDVPHLQMTGKFGVNPDDGVRQIYMHDGVPGVWKACGLPDALAPVPAPAPSQPE